MIIEKNDKMYVVKEFKHTWKLTHCAASGLTVNFNVAKADYSTFAELKRYVLECSMF